MVDGHLAAVRAAEYTTRRLRRLFGRLGTEEHPRGVVLAAYRVAHRALRDVYRNGGLALPLEVNEVLAALRRDVEAGVNEALRQAVTIGEEQAGAELEAYGVEYVPVVSPEIVVGARDAVLTVVDGQIVRTRAIVAGEGPAALVLGDDTRVGILYPGQVVQEAARWLVVTAVMSRVLGVGRAAERTGIDFRRQAVAAIDERTTDCCLRAHGQIVGMEEDFVLTGTPRFADKMRDPPFHWYCRTSQVLIRAEDVGDDLTREMEEAAQAELAARAEAQGQVDEIKRKLADLGAMPDVRVRAADTDEVKRLREELRMWKARVRMEIHPAGARSGR